MAGLWRFKLPTLRMRLVSDMEFYFIDFISGLMSLSSSSTIVCTAASSGPFAFTASIE